MREKKYACGRTKKDDYYLCCTRRHYWWNTKKVKDQYGWNVYCRFCGHLVMMTSCKNKKDVKLGW